MSTQNVNFQLVVAETDFLNCNTFSIINQSTIPIRLENLDTTSIIFLNQNQSVTLSASTGFVLPPLRVAGGIGFSASVITT